MNKNILRPNFTENIYELYIQQGKSLNIFGEQGMGKSRFIDDLKLLVDDDTHFVSLDMRNLRTNYIKFVKELKVELGIEGNFETIELVLAEFSKKSGKKVLVIDHFEYLFEENHDKAFNFYFFDQLNSFKNNSEVSLVLLSTRNYKHYHFYKGSEQTTSPLDIEVMEITPLLHQEIEDELKRGIKESLGFESLASMVMGSKYSYSFITFIIREIEFGKYNKDDFLENNFKRWEKQFYKINRVWHLQLFKFIKKINPKSIMSVLKEVVSWFKKKD